MEIVTVDLLDPAHHDLAQQWIGVHNASQVARLGDSATTFPLDAVQAVYRSQDELRQAFAALDGPECVGALDVRWSLHDNPDQALVWLSVHPDHTRRGVGTALLAQAERVARAAGRHALVASSETSYDALDPAVPFAQSHGYTLARSSARSLLAVPDDRAWREAMGEIAAGGGVAECADPGGYRLESVVDRPPQGWWKGMAGIQSRLDTDAPAGERDLEPEHWDAGRMERDVTTLLDVGRRVATTVAFDPTGAMVALTLLVVQTTPPDLALQRTTLVLREHRGRRLGLRVKAANLVLVARDLPPVRRVCTWNADDNTPMLAVNHALGFVGDGVECEWQRHLA